MTGSEKQVQWAEEIKANLIRTYNAVIPMMPDGDRDKMLKAIDKLESITHAHVIIDAYKWINFSGDAISDIRKIMACHRNMMPDELALFMPGEEDA